MKKEFLVYVESLSEKEIRNLEEIVCVKKAEEERTKKEKAKNKKHKKVKKNRYNSESGSGYRLLGCIGGFAVLIISAMLVTNYMICFQWNNTSGMDNGQTIYAAEKKVESTIVTTGLTMIGLAISVWAGLNIVQVLEKGKVDALGKEVEEYRSERYGLNKNSFLNNILQLEDALNGYLYRMFSQMEDRDENLAALYFECNKIEFMFQNVYGKQKKIKRNISTQYYQNAIEETESLIADVIDREYRDADKFITYLKIRLAEFNFYLGYNVEADESIECFQAVTDYFYEVFEELKTPELIMEKRYYLDSDKQLTLYMFNTMGEAYSKILQAGLKKDKAEYLDKVIEKIEMFYGYAIELIERIPDKKEGLEVYYRNYGCALERINEYRCNGVDNFEDKETFNKIKSLYQKAIDDILYHDKEKLREQTFYVYVSLYYKYMKNINIMECLNQNLPKLNIIQKDIKYLEEYTHEVEFYADLAMNVTPLNMYMWKIKAFVERDFAVWAIAKADINGAKCHYERLVVWWERIKQAAERNEKGRDNKKDDMSKELDLAVELLGKYFTGGFDGQK